MLTARFGATIAAISILAAACSPAAPSPAPNPTGGLQGSQAAEASTPAASTPPSPAATPAPPATTTFSTPVIGGTAGRPGLSTSITADGSPVADLPVVVTTTALGKTYQTLTLKGVVPLPAKSLIVQLGFNNQPDTGPVKYDIKIYRITYADGGKSKNRLPNGGFDSGLFNWAVYGEGNVTTPRGDGSGGRVLRLRADPDQEIVINSYGIPVTPGSDYTMTVTAEVPPAGSTSGYVAAIFLKDIEIWRETLKVVAPEIPATNLRSGADGSIVLDQALPAGRYLVRIAYPGNDQYAPVVIEQEVTVT